MSGTNDHRAATRHRPESRRDPALEEKLEALRGWFAGFDSALVAYSGGVDSALLMRVAHDALSDRALACIGVSPSYPKREREQAVALAKRLGVPYRLIETREHLDPDYAANPDNRCYFCKDELYGRLARLAADKGWSVVVDGTNASDLGDDRPGRVAADERGVRSPLVELSVTKPVVRALAKGLGLPVWDKPAMACLASRVPHGTAIDGALLARIDAAEDALVALGFTQFRVRHHGDLARIELPRDNFDRAIASRNAIVEGVRAAGYRHVTLDLAGFRNEPIVAAGTVALTVDEAAPASSP